MNRSFEWLVFSAVILSIVLMMLILIGSSLPATKYILYKDNVPITTCHSKSFFLSGFSDCDNGMSYMNYSGEYKAVSN